MDFYVAILGLADKVDNSHPYVLESLSFELEHVEQKLSYYSYYHYIVSK